MTPKLPFKNTLSSDMLNLFSLVCLFVFTTVLSQSQTTDQLVINKA